MTDNDLMAISGGICVAGLLVAWALWPDGGIPTDENDGPGPNLVIEMGGQATGFIVVDLLEDVAPESAERLAGLAQAGAYNGVAFHRVIDGFMAQTGDIQFGNVAREDVSNAGFGVTGLPNVPAEISDIKFERGIVGMARGAGMDSADSQFFIMFDRAPSLDGQYTVVGRVVAGMDVVDQIKRGNPDDNGKVDEPDFMAQVFVED